MMTRFTKIRLAVVVFGVGLVAAAPAFAGSVVVGSVLGATEATMGPELVIPGSAVFSGDDLRIRNGVAVVTVGQGSRIVFGRDSLARFERESDSVTTILADGSISVFHPLGDKTDLHFRIGNVTITPARGYETLGEVVMNSNALVISASQGLLTVQANGTTTSVTKGHSMNLIPKASRAPQTGVAQKVAIDWPQTLLWAGAGASGVAAILAGISISRSSDAKGAAECGHIGCELCRKCRCCRCKRCCCCAK